MKLCRPQIGFNIKVKCFLNAVFLYYYYYKNGVYLQECFVAFILGVENVQGVGPGLGSVLLKFSR